MRRDLRIANSFYNDKIKDAVDVAIAEILKNPDWYTDEFGESYTYMLDCYAGDHWGQHQDTHIADGFGFRYNAKDTEWLWEEIERTFDNVADILNKRIVLTHERFDYLSLSFGNLPDRGDWGLMLVFELKPMPTYCIKCEHCVFDKWVPNHPLFKCLKNGEMETATTETRSCPEKDG